MKTLSVWISSELSVSGLIPACKNPSDPLMPCFLPTGSDRTNNLPFKQIVLHYGLTFLFNLPDRVAQYTAASQQRQS